MLYILKQIIRIFCADIADNQVFKICTGMNDNTLIWEHLQENLGTKQTEYKLDRFGKIEAITHFFKICLLNEFRLHNDKRRINALQVVNL